MNDKRNPANNIVNNNRKNNRNSRIIKGILMLEILPIQGQKKL